MPRQYSFIFFLSVLLCCGIACNRQNSSQSTAQSNPPQIKTNQRIVPITNMVLIKPGSFMRGKFRVTLTHDYWIGKYEVTQGEYTALMTNNPSNFEGDTNRPVEKVKFTEAQAYCAALTKREMDASRLQPGYSYRLPTEAEWEY